MRFLRSYLSIAGLAMLFGCACKPTDNPVVPPEPDPDPVVVPFAKGADIGWVTEMEAKGYKFYNAAGTERECTALMMELGCNAIRHRVWVDPMASEAKNAYCGIEDLVVKCKRVSDLGMRLMVDFHYSDWWADPGKQNIPASWTDHSAAALAKSVAEHTRTVLKTLKDKGIDVTWVQVGNEVTNGMLWETCRVKGNDAANFVKVFNAGAAAVREIYPEAQVILHIDNAWKTETLNWFFALVTSAGARYDMIGLSLYPSYWEGGAYPDWQPKVKAAVSNIRNLNNSYGKPVMLTEFGMPAYEAEKSKAALQYILDNTRDMDFFKGVFLWEPESEKSRNGYDYGAFSGGKATVAMDPFKNDR